MTDFKGLRKLSILKVCDFLGIPLKQVGAYHRGACPICKHKSQRAFVVTPKLNRWWCHGGCKEGGDPLELLARHDHITHREAARVLVCHFGMPPY